MKRMRPKRVDVAGIAFDPITQDEVVASISEYISGKHSRAFTIVKPYVEFFTRAWADEEIRQLISRVIYE